MELTEAYVQAVRATHQDPPCFRDILQAKVGQECEAMREDSGIWALEFAAPSEDPARETPFAVAVGKWAEFRDLSRQLERVPNTLMAQDRTDPAQIELELRVRELDQELSLLRSFMFLTAVGSDFIQLREADGTERFIPLARVDVVVKAAK